MSVRIVGCGRVLATPQPLPICLFHFRTRLKFAKEEACLTLQGDLGHWKRPKSPIVTAKSADARRGGGPDVTIITTTINLDRLPVHCKWEISVVPTAVRGYTS